MARVLPVPAERNTIIKLRVLLLEDSPLDADLVLNWLNEGGLDCRITCVQTRAQFVDALGDAPFDVILADYSLPGFDGLTALELAQQMQPQLPFIFVSGYLGEDLAIETLKRGATDYVLKDRLERLVPSVERAIRESKEREERQRIETTLRVLSEASLSLSSLDYSTTLSHMARLAVPHFADYCIVDLVAEDGGIERVAVAHANSQQNEIAHKLLDYAPLLDGQHPVRAALETKESRLLTQVPPSLIETNVRDENHLSLLHQLGMESCMIVPLLAEGVALGAMTFISASNGHNYDSLDLSLAEDLARRCALALENARLHRKTVDALRARDEFLAVLSHELRSPLTSILGWVQLLQEGELEPEMQLHAIGVIERNTKAQVQLIQDLLEVSRIITGRLRLDMVPVTLAQVISNVIDLMTPTAKAKDIELKFNNEAKTDRILGDEASLQQVFWNLVSNALKFTPKGGLVNLSLSSDDEFVTLEVRDSGEGIEPSFLPYVFDRFRQANSTSTRQHGGLGLGLAIVRHLTEMHGGTAEVHSSGKGEGASFTVKFPLRASLAQSITPTQERGPQIQDSTETEDSKSSSIQGLQILLVEDGNDARELLAAVLRQAGAKVTAVNSVQGAIQELNKNAPDVLISDIGMPDEDGYSLIRRVRASDTEDHRQIPAIALTAYASEQDRLKAIEAGFQMHLAKPVEPSLLLTSLASLIRNEQTA